MPGPNHRLLAATAAGLLLLLSACSGSSSQGPIIASNSPNSGPPASLGPITSPAPSGGSLPPVSSAAAKPSAAASVSASSGAASAKPSASSGSSAAVPAPGKDAQASPGFVGGGSSASPAPSGSAGVTVGQWTPYKDSFGRLRVAGYLVNSGQQTVTNVQAIVSLEDSGGRTLQQEHSIYTRNMVPPGQRTPFLTLFMRPPPDWTTAAVQVKAEPAPANAGETAILNSVGTDNVKATENGQGLLISGDVKNGWTKPVTQVTVLGILYDASGKTMDVRESSTSFQTIAPGKTASFGFEFYNSSSQPADQLKWDLYVDAAPAQAASASASGRQG